MGDPECWRLRTLKLLWMGLSLPANMEDGRRADRGIGKRTREGSALKGLLGARCRRGEGCLRLEGNFRMPRGLKKELQVAAYM